MVDYVISRSEGYYAVCCRCGQRVYRGPFRWRWLAELACYI